ncbi:MAG TPA: hypothetical protein VHC22_10710 [Pirellulales bacterium]|nr:hypothetical protein [Pirellulales bacterium]
MVYRRRLQFRLATLLLAVAVAAFAAHWFAAWQRADGARREFEQAESAGEISRAEEASSKQLAADLAVPFANSRRERIAFLNRMASIQKLYENILGVGFFLMTKCERHTSKPSNGSGPSARRWNMSLGSRQT